MIHHTWKLPLLFFIFSIIFLFDSASADFGWKAEEPILGSFIDTRFSDVDFDNKSNRVIATFDGSFGSSDSGGNYAVRPHNGPIGGRLGPSTAKYFTTSIDGQGNAVVGYHLNGKIFAAYIPAGTNFLTKVQDLGNTVPYNGGRIVDVHITTGGLAAIIWLDSGGKPNVAFRATGADAQFDIANKVTLDTSPSSSAGNVFIAREENGGAFAIWRRDSQNKQAYYAPGSSAFDVQALNFAIPVGDPPAPGKINSGALLSLEFAKNGRGDVAMAYGIYTSVKNISVAPFSSISVFYSYRKRGEAIFGQHVGNINPDDIEEDNTRVALLPDGRAVVVWLKTQEIPNPCPPGGIGGPYIGANRELRAVISDANGTKWEPLLTIPAAETEFISPPLQLGVAKDRAVIAFEKTLKQTQCSTTSTKFEYYIVRALWPGSAPAFTNDSTPIAIPGMLGFGTPFPHVGDLGAIGVSDIGTVAILAGMEAAAGADTTASLFVWESGLEPGVGPEPTPQATPAGGDTCPSDPNKTEPGKCGCGFGEIDSNADAIVDCGNPGKIGTKGGVLSNAPKIEVTNKGKGLSLLMQLYQEIISGNLVGAKEKGGKGGNKTPKIDAVYEVTAQLQGSKLKCGKVKVESKTNRAVLKNLLTGTYDVSYKIIFKQGKKKIGQTSQSPSAQGVVTDGKTKCPIKKKKKN